MKQILTATLLLFTILAHGQGLNEELESADIKAALKMLGIEIFKYDFSQQKEDFNLIIHLDELADDSVIISKSYNLGKWDSVAKLKELRIIPKISSDTTSIYWVKISHPNMEFTERFDISPEFRHPHFWHQIQPGEIVYSKKTPLVFYGMSWESEFNGMKIRRFCWGQQIDREMKNETLKKVGHMILISYELVE